VNLTVDQLIEEAQEYLRLSLQEKENPVGSLVQSLVEKIIGDSRGQIARVELNKGCPSAVRERLQIASDTAKMNEKNLRAREEALKGEIETASGAGDTARASKLQGEMERISSERSTNLKNIDKLESIASDYALKYKPKDDLYDQRGHALFLQREREKLEQRMAHEQEAPVANGENMDKIKRRLERIQSAQTESEKWLSEKDPKWLRGQKASQGEQKDVDKREKDRMATERKAEETAKKEAGKAQEKAASEAPPEVQAAAERKAAQGEEPNGEASPKTPGSVWQTANGRYGAINKGGIQKYFGSEEEAKSYSQLDRGQRRSGEARKRRARASAETQAGAEPVARKIIRKKLESGVSKKRNPSKETASPGVAPTPPGPGRSTAKFGKAGKRGAGFGSGSKGKTGYGRGKRRTMSDSVSPEGEDTLMEVYRDSGLGKWFHGESGTKEPGWDRYNTKGERAGKCGDAKEGEPYAACLSRQKADKLGKEGIASFVRRKRRAQKEAGMGKKGETEGSGKKPVFVSTGIDKVNEASENEPTNPELWKRAIALAKQKFDVYPSAYANAWAAKWYKGEGGGWRKADSSVNEAVSMETMEQGIKDCIAEIEKHKKLAHAAKASGDTKEYTRCRNIIASRSSDIKTIQDMIKREKRKSSPMSEAVSAIIANSLQRKNELTEEEKPYKGFVKGKNHPEGGLSRAEAKRQGIRAGIDTKDEAERKGGFSKLSPETQKRRKSFCSRMCGMKAKNTSAETAADPDSKINAALRVWGCRC
jgi:hypothetical protein